MILCQVLVGRVEPLGPKGVPSGIRKRAVDKSVSVSRAGLAGDEHGDRRNHGGAEKAVHQYPWEHYAWWLERRPGLRDLLQAPGAFGENLSSTGMDESTVCIGDVYRLGGTVLQVSQGRQPCRKLNLRFEDSAMARSVQDSGRTGWYYRVLEAGEISPGDRFVLAERPQPAWTIARLLHYFYVEPLNFELLQAVEAMPELAESWRRLARTRLERGEVEDWRRRLGEAAPGTGV